MEAVSDTFQKLDMSCTLYTFALVLEEGQGPMTFCDRVCSGFDDIKKAKELRVTLADHFKLFLCKGPVKQCSFVGSPINKASKFVDYGVHDFCGNVVLVILLTHQTSQGERSFFSAGRSILFAVSSAGRTQMTFVKLMGP